MKKLLFFIMILTVLSPFSAYADETVPLPDITSENIILADRNSKLIIYEKNAHEAIQPASYVKIMTAIVALENIEDLSQTIVADADTIDTYDYSFGNMGILKGERIKIEDLINGILLYDAGEAAELVAKNTFETYDEFIDAMNKKAQEIGAVDTHFTNASGLYDNEQISTLYDMYLISKYAMDNEKFKEIVYQNQYISEPTNMYKTKRYLTNTNEFVNKYSTSGYYTGLAQGIKTSKMPNEGYGVALDIKKGNSEFICICANSPTKSEAYQDVKALTDYGFNIIATVKIKDKDEIVEEVPLNNAKSADRVLLKTVKDIYINIPRSYDKEDIVIKIEKNENIKAPIDKDEMLGSITVLYKDTVMHKSELVAGSDIERNIFKSIRNIIKLIVLSPIFITVLITVIAVFAIMTVKVNFRKK